MKVLNLYAGIGGNRKLWTDVEVTAVEIEPQIAEAYKHFFPNDKMVVGDAHQYLLDHFEEYDFIWASPPCPTHSVLGKLSMIQRKKEWTYPCMKLYQEIIFLREFFKGKWVVENTKSYYEPLIEPYLSGSHYFWANFHITNMRLKECRAVGAGTIAEKQRKVGFDLEGFSFATIKGSHKKDKVLNNCVEPKLGLHIMNCAMRENQLTLDKIGEEGI